MTPLPPISTLFPYTTLFRSKVRPNHETNINIIARRTGKDVNSHTVLDGIITTIMDCVTKIGRAVQQECRDRSRMPSSAYTKIDGAVRKRVNAAGVDNAQGVI